MSLKTTWETNGGTFLFSLIRANVRLGCLLAWTIYDFHRDRKSIKGSVVSKNVSRTGNSQIPNCLVFPFRLVSHLISDFQLPSLRIAWAQWQGETGEDSIWCFNDKAYNKGSVICIFPNATYIQCVIFSSNFFMPNSTFRPVFSLFANI